MIICSHCLVETVCIAGSEMQSGSMKIKGEQLLFGCIEVPVES